MKKGIYILIVATIFMGPLGPVFLSDAIARGDGDGKGYLLHNRNNCPLNDKTTCFPRMR